jgi:2-(1,2-epoxy-1,2-dihydrophenyl)acetyl-CoA isomerase
MNDAVLYESAAGIAVITLNRPDRLNAVNYDMMVALLAAVQRAAADQDAGVVIVTGAGRGFCAGGDRKDGARPPPGAAPFGLAEATEACRLLREMPKPTIAMVNGPVAGAGIGVAGCCDLRFAGESATFLSAYENIGASGDYGATYTVTRALGAAKAREIFLLGEKFTAAQALAFGIYTRVYPDAVLRGETMAAARRLADGPRPGWGFIKDNINAAETLNFRDHLQHESRNMGLSGQASARYFRDRKAAAAGGETEKT